MMSSGSKSPTLKSQTWEQVKTNLFTLRIWENTQIYYVKRTSYCILCLSCDMSVAIGQLLRDVPPLRARNIIRDSSHPTHTRSIPLRGTRSGTRCRSLPGRPNRTTHSFFRLLTMNPTLSHTA